MKTLIVGGTGLVGGHAAVHLTEKGHDVTIMSRNKPTAHALQNTEFMSCNYIEDDVADGRLEGFDALVFAAAQDIRQLPMDGSIAPDAFYKKANDEAVPRFFEAAKAAGISRTAYVGSFYPQIAPERIAIDPYVNSRHVTDEAVRALSSAQFKVCSLNAPFILGQLPGLDVPHILGLIAYVSGQLPDLPLFAPQGGTNHITAKSVAESIEGALERGESGKAYLIGDENYTWKEYLEAWASAAGAPVELEVRSDDHPILPNAIMFAGAGALVNYEPDADESALLNYGRKQVAAEIQSMVQSAMASAQG
ncbi:MAG: NAD-dependent epimerase/dehydratase family protein [Pseudomonadales bacterium]